MKTTNNTVPASSVLSPFARAYLVCALWSSNDNATPSGGEPLDRNYHLSDLAPESLERAIADCAKFQEANAGDIGAAELDDDRAGHCFWLNRNGHGSGFWDEYFGSDPRRAACDRLSDASKAFGESDLYVGDDGKLYLT